MLIRAAKRTESVQEYYFSRKLKEIAAMNARRAAEGEDLVINLGIGSPDGMPPFTKVFKDNSLIFIKLSETARDEKIPMPFSMLVYSASGMMPRITEPFPEAHVVELDYKTVYLVPKTSPFIPFLFYILSYFFRIAH